MLDSNLQYISLSDAAKYSEVYSQEYLSLRARQGKFKAIKLGRNWVTTKQWVDEYIHAEKNVKANGIVHEEKQNLILEKQVSSIEEQKQKNNFVFPKYIFKFALASSIATILVFTFFNFAYLKNLKNDFIKQNDLAVESILNGYAKVVNYKKPRAGEYKLFTQEVKKIKEEVFNSDIFFALKELKKETGTRFLSLAKTEIKIPEIKIPTFELPAIKLPTLKNPLALADDYLFGINILTKEKFNGYKLFLAEIKLPKIKIPIDRIKFAIANSQERTNKKADLAFSNLKNSFIEKNDLTAVGLVSGGKKTGLAFANLKNSFIQQNDIVAIGIVSGYKKVGDTLVILREWSDRRTSTEKLMAEILRLRLRMTESGHFAMQSLKDIQKLVSSYFYGMPLVVKDTLALTGQKFVSVSKDYKSSIIETTRELGKEFSSNALALVSDFDQKNQTIANDLKNNIQEGAEIAKQKTKSLFASIKSLTIYMGENVQKGVELALKPWLEKNRTVVILNSSGGQTPAKPAEGKPPSVKEITREITKETTKETIVSKVDSQELVKLKNQITELQKLANKVQYYSPSNNVATSPVYIGSSGLEISGNAVLTSLGVSGSAGIRDLGVGNSFSVGGGGSALTVDKEGRLTASSITSPSITGGSFTSTGNITATGDLSVGGSANISGNLNVGGIAVFSTSTISMTTTTASIFSIGTSTTANLFTVAGTGNVVFQNTGQVYIVPTGTTTIGASTSTPTIITGYIASDILPYYDNTYSIGSSAYRWKQGYFGDTLAVNGTSTLATTTATNFQALKVNILDSFLVISTSTLATSTVTQLVISGSGLVNGYLTVGTSTQYYPLYVSGDSYFSGNSTTTGNSQIAGNLQLVGSQTIGSTLNISATSTQATTSITQLLVSGNSILSGGLWASGTTTLATTTVTQMNASNYYGYGGFLTGLATTTFASSTITGSGTTTENYVIGGNLNVGGSLYGSATNLTNIPATTTFNSATISGTLGVTGTSTLATTSISLLTVSLNATVAGNFGIGTTTPSSKLSISGTAGSKLLDIGFSTGTSTLSIDGSGLLTISLGDHSSTSMSIQEGTNTYLTFDTSNDAEKIVVGKNLEVGQMNIDPDSGAVNFADMAITSTSVTSTVNSLSIALDGNAVLTAYGESSGHAGILQNLRVGIGTTTPIAMLGIAGNAYSTGPLLRISTSTTEALFIDAMGLVGIGTTSPIAMLSVRGGTNATAPLFRVSTTSIEAFYIDPTGKIGIGTTTPYYSLDILARSGIGTFRIASSSAYNTLLIDNNGLLTFGLGDNSSTSMSIAEGTNTYLTFDTSNDAEKIVVGKDLEIGIMNIDQDSGAVRFADMSVTASSTAGTANSLSIGIDGISVLTVYSSSTGNGFIEQMRVGIGTTTPLAMLDVVSSASTTGALMRVATSTGDKFFIDGMGLIGVATNTPSFALTVAGTQYTTGATYLGSTLNITGTSTQATTSITLLTVSGNGTVAGNFGIGTTTPSSKLSISGTAGSKLLDIGFSTGTSTLAIDGSGLLTISLGDNSSTSMVIQEGTNTYLTFDTSNDGEKIVVGKNLEVGQINVDADSGNVQFANMDVSTSAVTSTAESLSISIDGQSIITAYAEAMGNGFVQNYRVGIGTSTPIAMLSIAGNASTTGPMLRISTSTVEALFIDGMGLVGIGTTSPVAMLSVRGGTNATAPLFRVSTTSIEAFYIDPTGKIGIGTTSPVYSLDILARSGLGSFRIASSSVYNTLLIDNNGLLTFGLGDHSSSSLVIQEGTSGTPYLTFDTSNDAEKIVVGKDLEIGTMNVDQDSGAVRFANMNITASSTAGTANSLSIGLDQQDILTVYGEGDGNGMLQNFRVGIGTTTPVAMLTVIGNASTTGALLKIATSTINALFIDGMGNVGIGTSSPNTFMLEVAGNVGPSANSTYNLGSDSRRWATFYASTTWAQYINTGDLTFANNFRFTEAPASSSPQALYLSNQLGDKLLTIKEDGSLEIGSPEKPAGITLYDEDTHEPYCLKMKAGAMISVAGKCGDSSAESTPNEVNVPQNDTPAPVIPSEPQASEESQPPATTTEPEIISESPAETPVVEEVPEEVPVPDLSAEASAEVEPTPEPAPVEQPATE